MNHKQAVEGVRKLVTLKGGKCWVLAQSGRLYGSAGIPDIFCTIKLPKRGWADKVWRSFWVEVKVGRDRQKPAQLEFAEASGSAGIPVIVGTSLEVERYLEHATA
jgi:hypothetical protein